MGVEIGHYYTIILIYYVMLTCLQAPVLQLNMWSGCGVSMTSCSVHGLLSYLIDRFII